MYTFMVLHVTLTVSHDMEAIQKNKNFQLSKARFSDSLVNK